MRYKADRETLLARLLPNHKKFSILLKNKGVLGSLQCEVEKAFLLCNLRQFLTSQISAHIVPVPFILEILLTLVSFT